MKKLGLITWMVFVAVLIFLVPKLSEHEQLLSALRNGEVLWMFAAFLATAGMYAGTTELYRRSYRIVGIVATLWEMTKLLFASLFANIITPSMGLAGMAVFVKEARHHGSSHVRGVLGFTLESLFFQAGMVIVLLIMFAGSLLTGNKIEETSIILLCLTAGVFLFQIVLYAISYYQPRVFEGVLQVFSKLLNMVSMKYRKKTIFPDGWSAGRVDEMRDIVLLMMKSRQGWALTLFVSIAIFVLQVLILVFLFLAFRQEVEFSVLVGMFVGSSIAGAFFVGPHGVGVVELGLTLILSHYGVDRGAATLIAVAYRALTFWLPFFVGFFAFRGLKLFEAKEEKPLT